MESNRAARTMFDTLSENCIFYISPTYEFSHRLGQTRSFGDVRSMSGLPESGHGWAIYEPAVGERAERPYKKEPRSSRG
jgi:hypothetical protein